MWLSVAFATDAEHAEALSDALLALGALSVGVAVDSVGGAVGDGLVGNDAIGPA